MSVSEKSRLQVPMPKDLREAWEAHALSYGFDSLQAYVRFIAKADVDGRVVHFDASRQLSEANAKRYNSELDEFHSDPERLGFKAYSDADELVKDLWS